MAGERITITITPKGMKVDASGFKGKTCLAELAKFQQYLKDNGIDLEIEEQVLKPEIRATETTGTQQQVRR